MSRTDVHRPYRVLLEDPHSRHLFVRYFDGFGPALYPIKNLCGCRMCTGYYSRKFASRKERAWWRKQRHHLLTTALEDRDTLDVPPFRSKA